MRACWSCAPLPATLARSACGLRQAVGTTPRQQTDLRSRAKTTLLAGGTPLTPLGAEALAKEAGRRRRRPGHRSFRRRIHLSAVPREGEGGPVRRSLGVGGSTINYQLAAEPRDKPPSRAFSLLHGYSANAYKCPFDQSLPPRGLRRRTPGNSYD